MRQHEDHLRELNEALEAEVARLTERQQHHLELIRRMSNESISPHEADEIRGQMAGLMAEVGTLRAELAEARLTIDELEHNHNQHCNYRRQVAEARRNAEALQEALLRCGQCGELTAEDNLVVCQPCENDHDKLVEKLQRELAQERAVHESTKLAMRKAQRERDEARAEGERIKQDCTELRTEIDVWQDATGLNPGGDVSPEMLREYVGCVSGILAALATTPVYRLGSVQQKAIQILADYPEE